MGFEYFLPFLQAALCETFNVLHKAFLLFIAFYPPQYIGVFWGPFGSKRAIL
ncbi:MAG: hypothetical protein U5L45_22315 [Saprospiraceae bacterium]|nr:hypothetical protein [Saprospiraceae bacterium]